MIHPVDLLPVEYAERRAERRNFIAVVAAGAVLLLGLVAWYLLLQTQVSSANDQLADVQSQNTRLEEQIAELQRFADLEAEVQSKEIALRTVMAGDVAWPSILTEVAMVIPGEVWLTNLTASATGTEGETQVGTETAPVRVSDKTPVGRIQFQGSALSMPGVAKWMIRLQGAKSFEGVWLNSAAAASEEDDSTGLVTFDNTLELNQKSASGRFTSGGVK